MSDRIRPGDRSGQFSDESDDALMRLVQKDDAGAFEQLYDRHASLAFSVAYSVSHDRQMAEEVVQEGFLSIWRGRASYTAREGCSFRGWAMEVVRHRAIDSQRKRGAKKRPSTVALPLEDALQGDGCSPLEEMIESSRHAALRGLLGQLPKAQAEVIAMAFFEGMTHTKIAERLELPTGTVKGRMRLGIEKLRRGMSTLR